ncbi:MAG: glycosyltransferase family 2 protein [Mariprofundaceae bacterium]
MNQLSVVVITFNEADNIARCLDSIPFADEIIVVDSGSTDDTCAIAKRYTDKVIIKSFVGFGEQKQFAVDQATGDWILSLDADEWLSEALQKSIRALLKQPIETVPEGYMIYRLNYYLGKPMRHCGWYIPITRLFKRGKGRFNDKLVHEEVLLDGEGGTLHGDILHVPYHDVFHHIEKIQRYAKLDAKEVLRRGRSFKHLHLPIHIVLRPIWKFFEKYFLQQGIREGAHGLILSVLAAFGVFLIHVHAWGMQSQPKDDEIE